jgi:hypothetical protein
MGYHEAITWAVARLSCGYHEAIKSPVALVCAGALVRTSAAAMPAPEPPCCSSLWADIDAPVREPPATPSGPTPHPVTAVFRWRLHWEIRGSWPCLWCRAVCVYDSRWPSCVLATSQRPPFSGGDCVGRGSARGTRPGERPLGAQPVAVSHMTGIPEFAADMSPEVGVPGSTLLLCIIVRICINAAAHLYQRGCAFVSTPSLAPLRLRRE